jgi:hypothetical protein
MIIPREVMSDLERVAQRLVRATLVIDTWTMIATREGTMKSR